MRKEIISLSLLVLLVACSINHEGEKFSSIVVNCSGLNEDDCSSNPNCVLTGYEWEVDGPPEVANWYFAFQGCIERTPEYNHCEFVGVQGARGYPGNCTIKNYEEFDYYDYSKLTIGFSTEDCVSPCKMFKIDIDEKGTLTYTGIYNTHVIGTRKKSLSADEIYNLLKLFEELNFFNMENYYWEECYLGTGCYLAGGDINVLNLTINSKTKSVSYYLTATTIPNKEKLLNISSILTSYVQDWVFKNKKELGAEK